MSDLVMVPQPTSVEVEVQAANRAEDVLNQLIELKQADEKSFLRKGQYMKEVRDAKHYKYWGYNNLEDFCREKLEYGARQVRTFVSVYERFVIDLGIKEERLLEIGSTKLAALSGVVTSHNVKELLGYAKENNVPNVNNKANELLGNDEKDKKDEDNNKPFVWQVALSPSQRDLINDTMELAKQTNGSDWAGAALEGICADYQSGLEHDATRTVLKFTVTEVERDEIGAAIDQARASGIQTVGALLLEAVRLWVKLREKKV